jgi:thioredoxin-like negative regulator of GroEL
MFHGNYMFLIKNNKITILFNFIFSRGEKYQKFAPVYEEAAHSVTGQIPFTKVDGAIEKKLCKRFEIITFPLVMLLKEGQKKPIIYLGDCEAHGFFVTIY